MTVYDRGEFEKAHARLRRDPAALTMDDIEQLTAFSPDLGREGVAAREAALFPAPAVPAPTQAAATKSGLSVQAIDTIAAATVAFVKQQLTPILTRLDACEQAREKGVSGVRWAGVFKQGEHFRSGELATHKGSLWVCQRATGQTPGRPADGDASDWVLIVKSGSVEAPP